MTAVGVPARTGRARGPASWRLLRLELRRNPLPWTAPLLALLSWYDSYRTIESFPPMWVQRAMILQTHVVSDLAPFVVGVAAWMGSRDGRRGVTDLVSVTSRPRWAAQLATWGATTCWALVAYAACEGALFAVIARQAAWGGPPWWLVAVDVAAIVTFSAIGFAAGAAFRSRYTAPLVAIAVFLILYALFKLAIDGNTYALIAPVNNTVGHKPPADIGIFYPYLPDLFIVRLVFLAGITAAALAVLGLPAGSGGRRLRRACAAVIVTGLAMAGTAAGLAGTARIRAQGMMAVPAVHDAADDRPIGYTPVCGSAGVPVCLHPAFRAYLPDVTAALAPVLHRVTGLPGAPVRVAQITTDYLAPDAGQTISGDPAVLHLPLAAYRTSPGLYPDDFVIDELRSQAGITIVDRVIAGTTGSRDDDPGTRLAPVVLPELTGGPAQQAIEAAILIRSGVPTTPRCAKVGIVTTCHAAPLPARGTPVRAAAERFAALPDAAEHAWLARHLTALRAGGITLARLP